MDEVFKALADPTRRSLLDELFERDGQSLSEKRRPAVAGDVQGIHLCEHRNRNGSRSLAAAWGEPA